MEHQPHAVEREYGSVLDKRVGALALARDIFECAEKLACEKAIHES